MESSRGTRNAALVLRGISARGVGTGESLITLLPSLAEGTMRSADIACCARLPGVAVELRVEPQPKTTRVLQRLAFWLAREGGTFRAIDSMKPSELEQLREWFDLAELALREVSPGQWIEAVRRVFATAGAEPPPGIPDVPELRLHVGGTGWNGFTFDPYSRLLFVPGPLAPPAGDVLRLSIEPAGAPGERCCAGASVVAVRRPAEAASGAPAGFTIALDSGSADASVLLAARCAREGARESTRASPRYPVVGGVSLTDPGEDLTYGSEDEFVRDYMSNLSHGGAFVRTARPRSIGDRVRLHLRLPGGRTIGIPATVVHRNDRGVGLEFQITGDAEAALSTAISGLAARPRRVLIVDDDGLVRRMLSDAFATRGFDTITAANGNDGFRAIVDELFGLDAVVTDVHMPGLSGDALVSAVRRAGGESELVLVAVTADWASELVAKLAASGADAVVPKAEGPAAVVVAVEAAIERRSQQVPASACTAAGAAAG